MDNEMIQFEFNGLSYEMTREQIYAAYRYQDHLYMMEDAKRHLIQLVECDDEADMYSEINEEKLKDFEEFYGITIEEALGLADVFVKCFEDRYDCNVDENSQWNEVIHEYLLSIKMIKQKNNL